MRLLVVEDDEKLNDELCTSLREEKIEVFSALNGVQALEFLKDNSCDLVLMDVDMPALDGISTMKSLKASYNVPVILMGDRKEEIDVIYAYEAGCIDYIRKPFFLKEVCLKIRNISKKTSAQYIVYGGVKIDTLGRVLYVDGKKESLTQKEFQLLKYLVDNEGIAIEREKLLNDVWGYGFFGDDRTIDTHIKMLRNSLGKYKDCIQTIRGFGYKFEYK